MHAPLAVAAWKGKGSLNVLVSKGMTLQSLSPCLPSYSCCCNVTFSALEPCGGNHVAHRDGSSSLLVLQVNVLRLLRGSGRQCRKQSRASHYTIKLRQCWLRKQRASSNRDMRQMLRSRARQPTGDLLCYRVLLVCMLSGVCWWGCDA